MGGLLTHLVKWWTSSNSGPSDSVRVLLLGLDGAGKTTILYKLLTDQVIGVLVPMQGVHIETVSQVKGVTFTMWDMAGGRESRPFWSYYYHLAQGIMYVVDSSDVSRVSENREVLHATLQTPELTHTPLLLLAHKHDLTGAMGVPELTRLLELDRLTTRLWTVVVTSVITNMGLVTSLKEMDALIRQSQNRHA